MNRRVLKKLLPVLVVVAGGLGAVATVATSEAKPVDPIFTNPVEIVPTVDVDMGTWTPPAQVEPPPVTEETRKPKPQPQPTPSGGGYCPECLDDPAGRA